MVEEDTPDRVSLQFKDFPNKDFSEEYSNLISVSLGRLMLLSQEERENIKDPEIVRALLQLISYNIAQISYLYAKIYKVDKVLITGNFIMNKELTRVSISKAMKFFSQESKYDCKVYLFLSRQSSVSMRDSSEL